MKKWLALTIEIVLIAAAVLLTARIVIGPAAPGGAAPDDIDFPQAVRSGIAGAESTEPLASPSQSVDAAPVSPAALRSIFPAPPPEPEAEPEPEPEPAPEEPDPQPEPEPEPAPLSDEWSYVGYYRVGDSESFRYLFRSSATGRIATFTPGAESGLSVRRIDGREILLSIDGEEMRIETDETIPVAPSISEQELDSDSGGSSGATEESTAERETGTNGEDAVE